MARQFKVEVTYAGPPIFTAQIYWHDNDTLEFVTMPLGLGPDTAIDRTKLLEELIAYIKKAKVNKVEVSKV